MMITEEYKAAASYWQIGARDSGSSKNFRNR
jgi:hypothetical protein